VPKGRSTTSEWSDGTPLINDNYFTEYTEVDAGGRVAVIAGTITVADMALGEVGYVYKALTMPTVFKITI